MIEKLIRNLTNPHLTSKKIYTKISNIFYKKNYNLQVYENYQNDLFSKLGLNRQEGIKKLNLLKEEFNFLNSPMSSEHQVLISSLSLKKKNLQILEIGTYNGATSFLLAKLFLQANITTIDLSDDDKKFKETYNRSEIENKNFSEERNKILEKCNNITFERMNSVNLTFSNKKFDLIYIDGDHNYPVIAFDLMNSLKLINSNGIILCDDIHVHFPENKYSHDVKNTYESIAAFEILNELKKTDKINFNLLYKRLDKENNSNPKLRKFIAFITLN